MKRTIFLFLFSFLFLGISCNQEQNKQATGDGEHHEHLSQNDPEEKPAKKPLSPRTTAMANIGAAHVHIDYSSPGVRGRTIWGGLVAYDQVWVTGAHKATSINFNKNVKINGQIVPAGTYGFFTIPGKEEWTVILNKNHEQHLADDYDEGLDVLRLKVAPEQLSELVEALTYEVTPTKDDKGTISVVWEYKKVSFDIEII